MSMIDFSQMTDKEIRKIVSDGYTVLLNRKEEKRQYLFNKLCQVLDEIEAEGFKTYDPQGEIIDSQNIEVASPEDD